MARHTRLFDSEDLASICRLATVVELSKSEDERMLRKTELHVECKTLIEKTDSMGKVEQLQRLFKKRLSGDPELLAALALKARHFDGIAPEPGASAYVIPPQASA